MTKCVVRGCSSDWYPACDLVFHSFPSNPSLREKWLSIVPLQGPYYKQARICSLHFKSTDYEKSGKRLRTGAIPFYQQCVTSSSDAEMQNSPLRNAASDKTNGTREPAMREQKISNDIEENVARELQTNRSLRNATSEKINATKKSLLRELLESKKNLEDTGENDISEDTNYRSVSPDRAVYAHKSVQAKLRTKREKALAKRNNHLSQKITRLKRSLYKLKLLMRLVSEHTNNQSELENILNGNFASICGLFRNPANKQTSRQSVSDEVKRFALTLHSYSAEAYHFLGQYIDLPLIDTVDVNSMLS